MKDELRHSLTPDDDGRAFTDAVLLRAAGALHRRRSAVAAQLPAWDWLAQWARPWVVAVLMVLAVATIIPARPWAAGSRITDASVPADSEVMAAALLPADMAVATTIETSQER